MHTKKGLILFVDDEQFVLQTVKAILRRDFMDYYLEFATSADEAMEIIVSSQNQNIEILAVFSDWQMPGKKGDQFLKEVHHVSPNTSNYLISGMIAREPEEDIIIDAGIKKVIYKPWTNEDLKAIVKEAVSLN